MRRMDRYTEPEERVSRSEKNKDVYQNLGSNQRYTNLEDITNSNAYDISNIDKETRTRENYQKIREYSNFMPETKTRKELDELKSVYKEKENRVYDINSVIAEARKNRPEVDEAESKRKLKNDKYNILLNMSKEELEEYRKERKEKFTHPDEEEIHDLIDTIASKTLAGEIDKNTSVDLLSELMATSMLDKVEPQEEITDLKNTVPVQMEYTKEEVIVVEENPPEEDEYENTEQIMNDENQDKSFITSKEINPEKLNELKEKLDEEEGIPTENQKDTDFYTRSMDLSEKDIEDDMDDAFKEKKLPILLKLFIFFLFIGIAAVAAFYIWKLMR